MPKEIYAQSDADSLTTGIADSTYETNKLIVWFHDGYLEPSYLGCDDGEEGYEYPWADGLPLSTDFILDTDLVSALEEIGVYRIDKLIKYLDPCRDSISISVRGDTVYIPDFYNILVMEYTGEYRAPDVCLALVLTHGAAVKYAEPNFYLDFMGSPDDLSKTTAQTPFDPEFSHQWQFQPFMSGSLVKGGLDIVNAWDRITGDPDIRIGMIDDGANNALSLFGGTGYTIVDGLNYHGNPSTSGNWNLNTSHGDYVTSIIGSVTNDSIGIAGVTGGWYGTQENCKIVVLRVGWWRNAINPTAEKTAAAIIGGSTKLGDSTGLGSPYDVSFACEFLNMSLRGDPQYTHSEILRAALAYAYTNDVVSVAGMGNDKYNHDGSRAFMPVDLDDRLIVGVSGSIPDGTIFANSDYGASVDFAAPFSVYAYSGSYGGQYGDYNIIPGTSGSTPLVTGCHALLRAYQKLRYDSAMAGNQQYLPLNVPDYLAPEDYQNIFSISANNVDDPDWPNPPDPSNPYRSNEIGYGVIDISEAMSFIEPPYSLVHLELTGELITTTIDTTVMYIAMPGYYSNPGIGLSNQPTDSLYEVIRDSIYAYISYGKTYGGTIRTWERGGRTVGMEYPGAWHPSVGITMSQRYPLYRNANWCRVVNWSDSHCELATYLYRVRNYGSSDQFSYIPGFTPGNVKFAISLIHDGPVPVEHTPEFGFALSEVYPSPAKHASQSLLTLGESSQVQVTLHDLFGRNIMTIMKAGMYAPGVHTLKFNTDRLARGTYFLRVIVNGAVQTKKVMKLR